MTAASILIGLLVGAAALALGFVGVCVCGLIVGLVDAWSMRPERES